MRRLSPEREFESRNDRRLADTVNRVNGSSTLRGGASAPRPALASVLAAVLFPLLGLSCRYDPVPQEIIDDLGPEQGTPSALHRPGQPCLACHSKYAGAAPQMTFGGTVYTKDADGKIIPAAGVSVFVADSAGDPRKACSNQAGNFYLEQKDWKEVAFPLTVTAGSRNMRSLIGRDGSCGSCHKLPDPEGEPDRNPVTGEGRDSAGVVLVNLEDTGDCGAGQ